MTEAELMEISNAGQMMQKSANKDMRPEVYEMFYNVGGTLLNCSRTIRSLQFEIVELKEQLKKQDIDDIKEKGIITSE